MSANASTFDSSSSVFARPSLSVAAIVSGGDAVALGCPTRRVCGNVEAFSRDREHPAGSGGDTGAGQSLRDRVAGAQRDSAPGVRRRVADRIQRRDLGPPERVSRLRARAWSAGRCGDAARRRPDVRCFPDLRVHARRQDHSRRHRRNGAPAVSRQPDRTRHD